MISVLYKRYALVFFLLWILATLSLAAAVLLSDAAMSGLLLFLVFLLLALGIFVKVLDVLRLQQQFDGLLRQGRNVKEQELSRMGALALRKELNIRRLQLIGLSAFADQRGEQGIAALQEAWSLAMELPENGRSGNRKGQLCAQLLLLETVSHTPLTAQALAAHGPCAKADAQLIELCAQIQDFAKAPSLSALFAMDALTEEIDALYVRQYAVLVLASLRHPLQPQRALSDVERLLRVSQLADVRSRAEAYRREWKEGKEDAGSSDAENGTVEGVDRRALDL